jgi:hypothetical protein
MRKLISRYDGALNIINFKLVKKNIVFLKSYLSLIVYRLSPLNKLILSVLIKT